MHLWNLHRLQLTKCSPLSLRVSFQFALSYAGNIWRYIGSTARMASERKKNKRKKYEFLRHCLAAEQTCHAAGARRKQVISFIVYPATCTCNKKQSESNIFLIFFPKTTLSNCNFILQHYLFCLLRSLLCCVLLIQLSRFSFALSYLHYNCKRWG